MNRISISLERRFLADTVALYIFDRSRANLQGIVGVAAPIVFRDQKFEEAIPSDPALEISLEAAQDLFDELYRLGFRPKEEGTAGALAATVAHLNDQRDLSTRLLGMLERKIFETPTITFGETRESE